MARRVVAAGRDAKCAVCGKATGVRWESFYVVLDFGGSVPPMEPGDLGEPVRCDACEKKHVPPKEPQT